ncbi:response regulator transcription factor, partial [Streptomyces sp. NPDC059411]|uniref:response regulator n=1 Tax=Streptomyces sp. NPDC059411 TaxID=3346825 RepID=UPI0036A88F55
MSGADADEGTALPAVTSPAVTSPAVTSPAVTGPAVTLLIADDDEVTRSGLRMLLTAQPGITVVGEAADGVEAVERARSLRPDVVLMDVRMPRLNGIEATRRGVGESGAPPI